MSEENDKINMAIKNERLLKQSEDKEIDTTTINVAGKAVSNVESNVDTSVNIGDVDASTESLESAESNKSESDLDETWAELTQDWQAQPIVKTDVSALLNKIQSRARRYKYLFALNLFSTVAVVVFFLYGVTYGQWEKSKIYYVGLASIVAIIVMFFEAKLRSATLLKLSNSPDKAIDNAIIQCKSSMKYMLISKLIVVPAVPFFNWYIYTVSQTSDKDALFGYLIMNTYLLLWYFVTEYLHRKRKKEYQQLLQLKNQ